MGLGFDPVFHFYSVGCFVFLCEVHLNHASVVMCKSLLANFLISNGIYSVCMWFCGFNCTMGGAISSHLMSWTHVLFCMCAFYGVCLCSVVSMFCFVLACFALNFCSVTSGD